MARIGAQSTTMDMVARECGISKRTLYETFPDKRTLIMDIVARVHENHRREFERIFAEADNNFEALLRVFRILRDHVQSTTMAFYDDIRRLYPDIHEHHEANERHHVEGFAKVLEKAKEQGFVEQYIQTDVAATIFFVTMRNLKDDELIGLMKLNDLQVLDVAFFNFMRGIATLKGIEYITNHIIENKEYNYKKA